MNNTQHAQAEQEQVRQRITLTRVLWVKFLRWVDRSSNGVMLRTLLRLGIVLLVGALYFAFDRTTALVVHVVTWEHGRIPLFLATIGVVFFGKSMVRIAYSWGTHYKRGSNQHTFQGVPVGELAQYILREQSFKQTESIRDLGLSQGQYTRISQSLEDAGVLVRGDKNARVLRVITLEQLVRQLRDKFPLVWSDEGQAWVERNGTYEKYCMSHDFKRRKLDEEIERKERKLERIQKKADAEGERIGALINVFSPLSGQ